MKRGIEACKAFVFVISPDSIASEHCRDELDDAAALNKLIIPVMYRPVDERELPQALQDTEWVFLREVDDFTDGVAKLVDALEVDLAWRDQHTRLAARAREWADAERDRSFVLRGRDLSDAETWLAQQEGHRSAPTGQQVAYIVESRRAATRTQRKIVGATVTALLVTLILAGVAWTQRSTAINQSRKAESRQLAAQASANAGGDLHLSSLLALEAYRVAPTEEAKVAALDLVRKQLSGVLTAHSWVWSVAVSSRGDLLGAGLDNGTVRLWDLRTRREIGPPLRGHAGPVNSIAFSPDGKLLVSGGDDSTVRLWSVATHREIGPPQRRLSDTVRSVAFSPDGTQVAGGGFDRAVRIWSVSTGEEVGPPLVGHASAVEAVAFSPDGRTLASGSNDTTVRLWSTSTHKTIRVLRPHADLVLSVAFSTDGSTLAAACDDGTVHVWDVATGRQIRSALRVGHAGLNSVAFSPDGLTLASGGEDNVTQVFDATTSSAIASLIDPGDAAPSSAIQSVTFGHHGALLVAGDADGHILLWNVALRRRLYALRGKNPVHSSSTIAFSPRGHLLASAAQSLQLWNTRTGRAVGRPLVRYRATGGMGGSTTINGVAFSPNGEFVASVSEGRHSELRIWDVRDRTEVGRPVPVSTGTALAFTPDGRTLAFTSDNVIRLWDLVHRRSLGAALRGHHGIVRAIAISPDGRTLASAGDDRTIRLWSLSTRRQLGRPLLGHTNAVEDVAFSADGRMLASGSWDKTVRLWDVASRRQIGSPLTGSTAFVDSVAFSPDGSTLASQSDDGKVFLWDVAGHHSLSLPLATAAGSTSSASVAFAPDGTELASASDAAPILWSDRLWDTDLATLEPQLCALVDLEHARDTLARIAPSVSYRPVC